MFVCSALSSSSSGRFRRDDDGPLQHFAFERIRSGKSDFPNRRSLQRQDVFARQPGRKQFGANFFKRNSETKQQKHSRLLSRRSRNG